MTDNYTLCFDIYKTYEIIKKNRHLKFITDKFFSNVNIKLFFININNVLSKSIIKIFVTETLRLIDTNRNVDIDKIMPNLFFLLKKEIEEEYKNIESYDVHDNNFFKYLSNKTLMDFLDELQNNTKFNENVKNMVINIIKNKEANDEIINNFKEIQHIIENYDEKLYNSIKNKHYYISYIIPQALEHNINKDRYMMENIIGIGDFGVAILYQNEKNDKKCIKIYFKHKNADEEYKKYELIQTNKNISDIFIKSDFLRNYKLKFINNDIVYFDTKDKNRKMQYLLMDYGEKIQNFNGKTSDIFNFICDVTKKILLLYHNGVIFTDLKLSNILTVNNAENIKFIDFDSFFFEKSESERFVISFADLIQKITPEKKDCKPHKIYMLKKVVVFKISLMILQLYNCDINNMEKKNFIEEWKNTVNDIFSPILSQQDVEILYSMQSQDISEIPELTSVCNILLRLQKNYY